MVSEVIVRRYPYPFRLVKVFGLTQRGNTVVVEDILTGKRERIVHMLLEFTRIFNEMEVLAWASK